jgi:hypothetical protein
VLCVRSAFDYALQRLRASRSRPVLLLGRTPETREDLLLGRPRVEQNIDADTYYHADCRSGSRTSQSAVR